MRFFSFIKRRKKVNRDFRARLFKTSTSVSKGSEMNISQIPDFLYSALSSIPSKFKTIARIVLKVEVPTCQKVIVDPNFAGWLRNRAAHHAFCQLCRGDKKVVLMREFAGAKITGLGCNACPHCRRLTPPHPHLKKFILRI